jgi:hypothetical protein
MSSGNGLLNRFVGAGGLVGIVLLATTPALAQPASEGDERPEDTTSDETEKAGQDTDRAEVDSDATSIEQSTAEPVDMKEAQEEPPSESVDSAAEETSKAETEDEESAAGSRMEGDQVERDEEEVTDAELESFLAASNLGETGFSPSLNISGFADFSYVQFLIPNDSPNARVRREAGSLTTRSSRRTASSPSVRMRIADM